MAEPAERFRVLKRPVPVRVRLATGRQLSAIVQCGEHAGTHHGRERVKDVLNAAEEIVPFWSESSQNCTLVNKRFVELVELLEPDLADAKEPDLTSRREVSLVLSSGTGLRGVLLVSTPPGQNRTLDFLNRGERFFYLDTEGGMYVVNLDHVVTVNDAEGKNSSAPPRPPSLTPKPGNDNSGN
jgi:hypothetical protein